jgi:hypothetical protein
MRYSALLLLLLVGTCAFADFGNSRIVIERVWTIDPKGEHATVSFDGMLAYNDSYHTVISTEVSDNAVIKVEDDVVHVISNTSSNESITVSANATVDILYQTSLFEDPPLVQKDLEFTDLTMPDERIENKAEQLKGKTALTTIRNLADWVYHEIDYDMDARRGQSAQEVFLSRRGVCVEYSHLFISMARSLGLDARYVTGYVMVQNGWQSHAWSQVYVPEHGWVHVDPTFGQAGEIDSSHLIISFGDDHSAIYDKLSSDVDDVGFSVDDSLSMLYSSKDPRGFDLEIDYQEELLTFDVSLENSRPEYLFGTYTFTIPPDYGKSESTLVLLDPNEERHMYHAMDTSPLMEGFSYTIPARAGLNDASGQMNVRIERPSAEKEPKGEVCPAALVLLSFLLGGVFRP